MTRKKKGKIRRYVEKNHLALVSLTLTILFGMLGLIYVRQIVINQTIITPSVHQASWHLVDTWELTIVTGPAPSQTIAPRIITFTFDWVGFWINVVPCLALCATGLGIQKIGIRAKRIISSLTYSGRIVWLLC